MLTESSPEFQLLALNSSFHSIQFYLHSPKSPKQLPQGAVFIKRRPPDKMSSLASFNHLENKTTTFHLFSQASTATSSSSMAQTKSHFLISSRFRKQQLSFLLVSFLPACKSKSDLLLHAGITPCLILFIVVFLFFLMFPT